MHTHHNGPKSVLVFRDGPHFSALPSCHDLPHFLTFSRLSAQSVIFSHAILSTYFFFLHLNNTRFHCVCRPLPPLASLLPLLTPLLALCSSPLFPTLSSSHPVLTLSSHLLLSHTLSLTLSPSGMAPPMMVAPRVMSPMPVAMVNPALSQSLTPRPGLVPPMGMPLGMGMGMAGGMMGGVPGAQLGMAPMAGGLAG